jgi:hypothetical protein
VRLNETPTVWNGKIELAILAQAATDFSQMRVLLSSIPNMLNDMVGYDKVETLIWKRELGPMYLGELITGSDSSFVDKINSERPGLAESQLGKIGCDVA